MGQIVPAMTQVLKSARTVAATVLAPLMAVAMIALTVLEAGHIADLAVAETAATIIKKTCGAFQKLRKSFNSSL